VPGTFLKHHRPAGGDHLRGASHVCAEHACYVRGAMDAGVARTAGVDDAGALRAFRGQRKSFPRLGVRGAACHGVRLPIAASSATTQGGSEVSVSLNFGIPAAVQWADNFLFLTEVWERDGMALLRHDMSLESLLFEFYERRWNSYLSPETTHPNIGLQYAVPASDTVVLYWSCPSRVFCR